MERLTDDELRDLAETWRGTWSSNPDRTRKTVLAIEELLILRDPVKLAEAIAEDPAARAYVRGRLDQPFIAWLSQKAEAARTAANEARGRYDQLVAQDSPAGLAPPGSGVTVLGNSRLAAAAEVAKYEHVEAAYHDVMQRILPGGGDAA